MSEEIEETAHVAVDPDYDFEEQNLCFYCGDDPCDVPCSKCGQELCEKCSTAVGCKCSQSDDVYATIDSFVPKPG